MQAVLDDESGRPPVLDTVQDGTLCVTRWEGDLYRAVVLWITHDYAKVSVEIGLDWAVRWGVKVVLSLNLFLKILKVLLQWGESSVTNTGLQAR